MVGLCDVPLREFENIIAVSCPHANVMHAQAGAGYLNDWNFSDKERTIPPSKKRSDTKYVDERDD